MKVEIDIRRPRWLPRSSRRWKLLGAVAVLALVAAPVGVWADHRFPDVPPGSGHTEVSKIADAGIVRGCGTQGQYCPENPVTRIQMAQFLSRSGGSASAASQPLPGALLNAAPATTNAMSIDVTVAGLPGQQQRVKIDADAVVRAASTAGCPCEAMFFLQDGNNPSTQFSAQHFVTVTDPTDATGALVDVPISLSYVFTAETGTTHTFFLTGQRTAGTEAIRAYGDITATTYPFPN